MRCPSGSFGPSGRPRRVGPRILRDAVSQNHGNTGPFPFRRQIQKCCDTIAIVDGNSKRFRFHSTLPGIRETEVGQYSRHGSLVNRASSRSSKGKNLATAPVCNLARTSNCGERSACYRTASGSACVKTQFRSANGAKCRSLGHRPRYKFNQVSEC